jgi:glycosyltransferase involved in cell wall biosynthesis
LREEAERLPAWASTLGAPDDSAEKLARKTEELALAELVICPSRFVQASLPAGTRSVVAEFGSPPPAASERTERKGRLRLLFAGAMTQRKGLADVFAALKLLDRDDIELVVMGAPVAPMDFYRRDWPHFVHEPPRPHGAVLALMDTCDALVLPSIVEGRALVQQEALSRGLPIIVTPNAGGEDLIEPGTTGWLVPIRDPASLAERIAWLADHRDALPAMRGASREMAAHRTWTDYTRKILAALDEAPR